MLLFFCFLRRGFIPPPVLDVLAELPSSSATKVTAQVTAIRQHARQRQKPDHYRFRVPHAREDCKIASAHKKCLNPELELRWPDPGTLVSHLAANRATTPDNRW